MISNTFQNVKLFSYTFPLDFSYIFWIVSPHPWEGSRNEGDMGEGRREMGGQCIIGGLPQYRYLVWCHRHLGN